MHAYVAVRTALLARRASTIVRLLRPADLVPFTLAVLFGGILAAGPGVAQSDALPVFILAALSALLGRASWNTLLEGREFRSEEPDSSKPPERPSPGLRIPPSIARSVGTGMGALALICAALAGLGHLGVAMAVASLMYLVGSDRRRLAAIAPWFEVILMGIAVVYGSLRVGPNTPVWLGAGLAVLLTLSREFIAGERERTIQLALVIIVGTVVASLVPFLYLGFGGIYLVALVVTDAILLRAVWLLIVQRAGYIGRSSHVLLWGMFAGLLSFALYWVG